MAGGLLIGESMDILIILRTFAAVTTVLAAALVAANLNARVTVARLCDLHRCLHRLDGRRLD